MGKSFTIEEPPPAEIPAALWAEAWESPFAGVRFDLSGRILWLKKAQEPRGYWRYRLMNLVARKMRLPVLCARPPRSRDEVTAGEAERIRQLERAGVRVPRIVAAGSHWLLLSHLGTTLDTLLEENRHEQAFRLGLLEATLDTLLEVHRNGQYLSQCFSRNILVDDPGNPEIGFIDFEEDPLEVMDLTTARARDDLLLMMSTVRNFEDAPDAYRAVVGRHLQAEEPAIRETVRMTIERLKWLRRLPAKRHLGRDFGRLDATLRVFA